MKTLIKEDYKVENEKGYSFDVVNHVHTLDGKRLYGITTILGVINKPALVQWSANMAVGAIEENLEILADTKVLLKILMPQEQKLLVDEFYQLFITEAKTAHRKKKEDAGTKGTDVHAEIEAIVNAAINNEGYILLDTTSETKQVQNFIDWAIANNVKFLASEKNVYSTELWCGGIADIVCMIDGKLYVGDVKTSSVIYPENYLQVSAYAYMLQEMGLYEKFDGVIILNCKKDGKFEYKFNYDLEENFQAFLGFYKGWKQLEALKTK